jgi:divalent metal cation (Fe/Co/Zn/Cd) transporter
VVAILLFALGSGISFYEGVHKIQNPHVMENAKWNYVVLALAFCFEAIAWWIALKEFNSVRGKTPLLRAVRESKDPALFTVLFEDSAAMLGLVAAFVGVFFADRMGVLWADGAASIAIGMILAAAAVTLAIETKGLLIGEAADDTLVEGIIGLAGQAPFVMAVNEVRTMHFGPQDVLVNLSVDARDTLSAGQVEIGIASLEDRIKAAWPEITRVFIEIQRGQDSDDPVAGPEDDGLPELA